MTPLERAARALAQSLHERHPGDCFPWEMMHDEEKANMLKDARAVLEAIREPSEGMQTAGYGECHHPNDIPEHIWQAMIDAALAEGA